MLVAPLIIGKINDCFSPHRHEQRFIVRANVLGLLATGNNDSHLLGVYHCDGTARTVGLELLKQRIPSELEVHSPTQDGDEV